MTFKVAVIGLGNIGMGFDYDCPDASRILTHASAFHYHPGFELVAGVDPSSVARLRFTNKYGKPSFGSVSELWDAFSPDLVALCVPTPLHFSVFQEIVARRPKAIICEKPLTVAFHEAVKMVDSAKAAGVSLAVNYIRRFEPGVLELKRRIATGEFGIFYKGVQWYTKGILTNGSHFIDLLSFLFGPVTRVQLLSPGRSLLDFDCEPDARISFADVEVYFIAARQECFSMHELQLISNKGEVYYLAGGEVIMYRRTRPHPLVPGCTILEETGERIESDLGHYQWHVAQSLYEMLRTGNTLCSTGATALRTMETVQQLMEEAATRVAHV